MNSLDSSSSAGRERRYAWYVVGVLTLANISGFIDRQILALLVPPIRRDLGLTLTQVSYLGVSFAVFFALMGIPIARMADRGSRRNVIAVGIAVWSIMTALCGLASTFWRLLLARFGVGVGEAALQAPATSLIADYFPRERLGSAMGVYSLGIFLGSGLAYFIGGWIVGLVSVQETWTWPLIGAIRPWQTVFMMVGLPGLLIALLMLTVREPARQAAPAIAPLSAVFAWIRANARTFVCYAGGFTLYATVNFGIAFWLATFLIQTYDMPAARAGMIQGMLTMTIGTLGVLSGGRLKDALSRRGHTDSAVRVGIVGAIGMLCSASAYPFSGSVEAVVVRLAIVNFFAALPWGAAWAGTAEVAPTAIRAQAVSVFILVLNLVSFAGGPWAVAVLTDSVFRDEAALGQSLAIVNAVLMVATIALLVAAMPAFRKTVMAQGGGAVH